MPAPTNPSTSPGPATGRRIVGLFHDRSAAESAIRELLDAGFGEDQIGVIMARHEEREQVEEGLEFGTPPADDLIKGAGTGAVVGGVLGLLGLLLIPGLGPLVVGGALATTLVGATVGAATGGLVGLLVGLGATQEEAEHFERGVRGGGIIVTVDAGARAQEAREILRDFGAEFGPTARRERRSRGDASYAGPERRMSRV